VNHRLVFVTLFCWACTQKDSPPLRQPEIPRPSQPESPDVAVTDQADSSLSPEGAGCRPAAAASTSLFFSSLSHTSTGDVVGSVLSLVVTQVGVTGTFRLALGALTAPVTISEIRADLSTGRLAFSVPNMDRSETDRFRGYVNCDSVWGTWNSAPAEGNTLVLRRVTNEAIKVFERDR
jgi:hypothetical protein